MAVVLQGRRPKEHPGAEERPRPDGAHTFTLLARPPRGHDDAAARYTQRTGKPPPKPPIVALKDATVVYPGGHVALERVSLDVERGEFAFVVGPTGCGKSTLIKMLIREVEPAAGIVEIAGRDIDDLAMSKVPLLRRRIGTVFQDFKLLPNRTVYDNVAYALQVIGEPRSEIRRKTPEILRLVGLQSKIHNYPDQLSGGEQQRVSIARAFVNHPPLLLADEPTGNLDPETSIGIMQLLYRINRTGTTVLVVTHDREHGRQDAPPRDRPRGGPPGPRRAPAARTDDESTREFAARLQGEMGVEESRPGADAAHDLSD